MANLFDYAPHELSHSAFWAYALASACEDDPMDLVARDVGKALLDALQVSFSSQARVDTEVKLGDAGRADILVTDGSSALVIEMKVRAEASALQLERYRSRLAENFSTVRAAILSAGFDEIAKDCFALVPGENYVGINDILKLVGVGIGRGSTLIDQYAQWIEVRKGAFERHNFDAKSSDVGPFSSALDDWKGQYYFYREILGPLYEPMRLITGTSAGRHWTQYKITPDDADGFFYRLETAAGGRRGEGYGPVLSLRYWGDLDEEKREMFDAASAAFWRCLSKSRRHWVGPRALNRVEKTILEIRLWDPVSDAQITAGLVRNDFPKAHRRFVEFMRSGYSDLDWR